MPHPHLQVEGEAVGGCLIHSGTVPQVFISEKSVTDNKVKSL